MSTVGKKVRPLEVTATPEISNNILETVGNTPLVRLNRVTDGLRATVVAKVELFNPGGSVKDRIGIAIIEDAERRGLLRPGGTIVEATSGNTGVGLALVAAVKGYKCVFVMPDKMSDEKIRQLRALGARVVVTPTAVEPEDPRSYYSVSRKIAEETPNSLYANQYYNPVNPDTHYRTTGPEIWRQTAGRIDALVVGMGTGGTISGTGKFLKEKNPNIRVIGADPVGSLLYEYFKTRRLGAAHSYKVEGIGEDFVPGTLSFDVIDEVIQVSDRESFGMARRLAKEEGLFCGGSAGTAVVAAIRYARNLPEGRTVVVILPDSGSRYLSKVYSDDWMQQNGFLGSEWGEGIVADVLGSKRIKELVSASPGETVRDVIAKMKEHDVSQVPVIDDGRPLGLITETDLLEHVVGGGARGKDEFVAALVKTDAMEVVDPSTSLQALAEIFGRGHVAVVLTDGKVSGIVTKIDLIDFLAVRMK